MKEGVGDKSIVYVAWVKFTCTFRFGYLHVHKVMEAWSSHFTNSCVITHFYMATYEIKWICNQLECMLYDKNRTNRNKCQLKIPVSFQPRWTCHEFYSNHFNQLSFGAMIGNWPSLTTFRLFFRWWKFARLNLSRLVGSCQEDTWINNIY